MSAESAIQTATLLQQKVGNSLSGVTNLLAPPERSDSMLNAGAASLPALVLDEVKELQQMGLGKKKKKKMIPRSNTNESEEEKLNNETEFCMISIYFAKDNGNRKVGVSCVYVIFFPKPHSHSITLQDTLDIHIILSISSYSFTSTTSRTHLASLSLYVTQDETYEREQGGFQGSVYNIYVRIWR